MALLLSQACVQSMALLLMAFKVLIKLFKLYLQFIQNMRDNIILLKFVHNTMYAVWCQDTWYPQTKAILGYFNFLFYGWKIPTRSETKFARYQVILQTQSGLWSAMQSSKVEGWRCSSAGKVLVMPDKHKDLNSYLSCPHKCVVVCETEIRDTWGNVAS